MSAALAHMCGLLAGHERVDDGMGLRAPSLQPSPQYISHVQSGFLSQHGPWKLAGLQPE